MSTTLEYVQKTYGTPAVIGRRVTVYGKPGIIAADRGHYIGVNFDENKPGDIRNAHPVDGVVYLGMGKVRSMTAGQRRYQEYLSVGECFDGFLHFLQYRQWQKKQRAAACLVVLLMFIGCVASAGEVRNHPPSSIIDSQLAVRAIVGEAANQGTNGMLAVAFAIRNRGSLQGVYGVRNPMADKQPAWVWRRAEAAWAASDVCRVARDEKDNRSRASLPVTSPVTAPRHRPPSPGIDPTGGATHWENVKAFGEPSWAKGMTCTAVIGAHWFYRETEGQSGKRKAEMLTAKYTKYANGVQNLTPDTSHLIPIFNHEWTRRHTNRN